MKQIGHPPPNHPELMLLINWIKKLILTESNKYCSINHWPVVHKTHPMMESMSNYIRFLPKLSLFSNLVEVFSLFYDMLTTTSLTIRLDY